MKRALCWPSVELLLVVLLHGVGAAGLVITSAPELERLGWAEAPARLGEAHIEELVELDRVVHRLYVDTTWQAAGREQRARLDAGIHVSRGTALRWLEEHREGSRVLYDPADPRRGELGSSPVWPMVRIGTCLVVILFVVGLLLGAWVREVAEGQAAVLALTASWFSVWTCLGLWALPTLAVSVGGMPSLVVALLGLTTWLGLEWAGARALRGALQRAIA